MARYDVVIVGMGPVGAALACLLGAEGVRALVVERDAAIPRAPRAIALDDQALRVLQLAGLPEGAFETLAIPYVQMRSPLLGDYARANTTGALESHPKLVTFFQPELEAALRACAGRHASIETRLGVEVTSIADEGSSVRVGLRASDGAEDAVDAQYVVGCDGAASFVRRAIGVGLTGRTFAEDWLVVDVIGAPEPIDHVSFHCDPFRPGPHMPAPGGRQRWEFKLRPGETRAQMERPEAVHELLRPWTRGEQVELERVAVYRFHARLADRFSSGRVLLAGDAAHLTPPFAGQGLVSGLRDVANLAWKLASAIQGRAGDAILASYDVERRPHAAATIDLALLMGRLVMPRSRLQALAVHGIARALGMFPPTRGLFGELQIKPANGAREGLFRAHPGDVMRAGEAFGQGLVLHDGAIVRSDDVLGRALSIVGLGVDPAASLDARARARWARIGGRTLAILHRGQRIEGARARCEDLTGRFLSTSRAIGRVVVVRPDRMVLCEGDAADATRVVDEALAMLEVPDTASRPQSSERAQRALEERI